MHINRRNSNNYRILRDILSKSRKAHLPPEARYLIIYAFIYKYYSDFLKSHFLSVIQDEEYTLDEAYRSLNFNAEFRNDAFHMFGYFIEKPDAFFDEVVNTKFNENAFLRQFFNIFQENLIFEDNSNNKKYMDFIFDAVVNEFPFNLYELDLESTTIIKDLILSISKLDVFDPEFAFTDVFEVIGESDILNVNSNPEYIYQILSTILISQKQNLNTIYDPFMGNGLSFLYLSEAFGLWANKYGKESDKVTYCYTIARLLMSAYNFDKLYLENEDAFESIDIDGTSFDGILSVIPIAIHNYHTSNKNQSLEIAKRHKREELEKMLSNNFNMDSSSFSQDNELNNVLEKLINKMDVDENSVSEFMGEYESLNDSEFLFLINLIDSLKNDGIMAISISQNFLFKDSLKTLRKYLTFEKNYIDAIINIPNEFGRYKRPEVVIVFKKNRKTDKILFIDMSRDFRTRRGRIVVRGSFKSNLLLDKPTLDKMCDVLNNKLVVSKFSSLVSMDEILKNGFNLSVSKYVDTFEGEFIRLKDLVNEKIEIDEKRMLLTKEIDKMMDELNIKF